MSVKALGVQSVPFPPRRERASGHLLMHAASCSQILAVGCAA
jgi:hypothetical protein